MPGWKKAFTAVVVCALLPLPLAFSLWGLKGDGSPPEGIRKAISPVLSLEEQRNLLSFGAMCHRPQDCEPPLGCLRFPSGNSLCVSSECQTDLQCPAGFTCRLIPTKGGSPLVRYCVVAGTMKEGEPCSVNPSKTAWACERGLLCNRYCGRPCEPGDSAGCPEGFICMEGWSGPSCHPTCEGRNCPEGQRCVPFKDGSSVCAKVWGEDCEQTPCPKGQDCSVSYRPGEPGRIKMECETPCDEEKLSCAQGSICYFGACKRPCDSKAPDACSPREQCIYHPDIKRWLCGLRDEPPRAGP